MSYLCTTWCSVTAVTRKIKINVIKIRTNFVEDAEKPFELAQTMPQGRHTQALAAMITELRKPVAQTSTVTSPIYTDPAEPYTSPIRIPRIILCDVHPGPALVT